MPLTRIKTKGLGTSVTFENITDTGTAGTKVATGTTAQRGSTTGQWRYNTTTGFFEGRNENEVGVVQVENGVYKGYGFLNKDADLSNQKLINDSIVKQKDNRDVRRIISSYMRKNPI